MDEEKLTKVKTEIRDAREHREEIDDRIDLEKMKLENNEAQAAERIRIAEEKVDIARKRAKK